MPATLLFCVSQRRRKKWAMQTAEAAGCAEKGEQAGWWSQAAVYAALLDVGVVFVAFWSISR
jgi:hypothetical protein